MTTRLRTRVSAIFAFISFALLAAVQPATAQQPIYSGGVWPASAPLSFDTLDVESPSRLPNFESAENAGRESLPLELIEDNAEMNAAVTPVSYEAFGGDGGGMKPPSYNVGGCTVTPYGVLWTDMIYSTSRNVPGQFILWTASDELQGEDTFQIEARYTRVGINIQGSTIDMFGGITGGGKVEVDFLGNFLTENQPDTRLRHAYWEAKNDNVRFLVGQYWDLISPGLPNTVNFSVNWGAGNIGFRRAQFRTERYIHLSDNVVWTLQGALAQNVIQDFRSGASAAGVTRETGNWPMIQARTALTFDRCSQAPVIVGVSGHIGETGFDFVGDHPANPNLGDEDDARFQTWSINVDANIPVTDRLGIHGEFFTGSNLSTVLGGIVQGVCPCLRVPVRSHGGWAEIWYDVSQNVTAHAGFGIDDPNDNDSLIGRTYNQVVYGNVFLDVTDHLLTGLEVSSWLTNYHNRTDEPGYTPTSDPTEPGTAVAIDWTVRYKF